MCSTVCEERDLHGHGRQNLRSLQEHDSSKAGISELCVQVFVNLTNDAGLVSPESTESADEHAIDESLPL